MRRLCYLLIACLWVGSEAAAGTPTPGSDAERAAGKVTYDKYCSQCHGDKGDGNGIATPFLRPTPRDLTAGKYKVRTTPNGALPTDQDLKNIIRKGMPYTAMPAWPGFTEAELTNLVYYVKSFHAGFADAALNVDPVKLPAAPPWTAESAQKGKEIYTNNGCARCHGNLGRGDGMSAPTLKDDWEHPIRPANLSQPWTFRGGGTREDIFRTLSTGFNGTPMPSFVDGLTEEQRWQVADWITSLSNREDPGYATLLIATGTEEELDLARGAELFAKSEPALFPIVGQIMEPGRAFHPAATAIRARAVYNEREIAIQLTWADMKADKTGSNSPALPLTAEDEKKDYPVAAAAAAAPAGGEGWGDEEAKPAAPAAGGDPWGEEGGEGGAAAAGGGYSDAVAIQFPAEMPTGVRKPYFIFGDKQNAVDLWFVDLAGTAAKRFVGKGSDEVTPAGGDDLSMVSSYADGEWSVILKRERRALKGLSFQEESFVPIAFSVWDGFNEERGNKRGLTLWFDMYVKPLKVESPVVPVARSAFGAFGVAVLAVVLIRRKYAKRT